MSDIAINDIHTMSSREITEVIKRSVGGNPNIRHDNVKRTVERLHQAGALTLSKVTPLEEVQYSTATSKGVEYLLNRLDSITVVAQLNPVVTAAIVKRWDELESQRLNSAPAQPRLTLSAKDHIEAASALADCFNLSLQAKRTVMEAACVDVGLNNPFSALPYYSQEGVTSLGQGQGTRPARALGDLLAENNIINPDTGKVFAAKTMNQWMLAKGMVQKRLRTNSKKQQVHDCYELTESFQEYGFLHKSKDSNRHQPHYFEDVFLELMNCVLDLQKAS